MPFEPLEEVSPEVELYCGTAKKVDDPERAMRQHVLAAVRFAIWEAGYKDLPWEVAEARFRAILDDARKRFHGDWVIMNHPGTLDALMAEGDVDLEEDPFDRL